VFAVICWTLGLSYRGVSTILSGFGIALSQMTVWRDAQEQAERMKKHNQWQRVRVLGVDGAYVLGWGEKRPVLVGVDLPKAPAPAGGTANLSPWDMWMKPIQGRCAAGWNLWCSDWG
jgi:hypothetical protein